MSENAWSGNESLSLSVARRVDAACNRFKRVWQEGNRPAIEDFLVDLPEGERPALLCELVPLEAAYRRTAGEAPRPEDYQARFPDLDPAWLALVLLPLSDQPPAKPSSDPAGETRTQRLRCPHCQSPIQLADSQGDVVLCPGCGSSFHVRDAHPTSTQAMRQLGKFQLLERVGLGAFGAVWKARDTELDRIVALKIPHTGLLTADADLERFHREARAAAQLRHPGIVTVHEVVALEGLPTIVSDFVAGVPLKDLLGQRRPTFAETAALMADVAEAVDYAHGMGLVHRDLKPANIMIEFPRPRLDENSTPVAREQDAVGRPLVMDFGLALRDEVEITMTLDGQILGTPAYMSPEQAAGYSHRADRRSDVYSLGVILYQLLTGELPFRGSKAMIFHQVMHEEPRPPRKINDKIPRDLETICLKALAKVPGRRYAAAREMADDLRRFLKGEPIQARPVGRAERGWRWCRRNPVMAGLGVGIALSLLVGTAVSIYFAFDAKAQAAVTKLKEADATRNAREAYANLYVAHMNLARVAWEEGNVERVRELVERYRQPPPPDWRDPRGWEWFYWDRLCHDELRVLEGHRGSIACVAFSPDGTRLASAGEDGTVRLWDVAGGRELHVLKGHQGRVGTVTFSPDGARLASAGADWTVRLWDAPSGRELHVLKGLRKGVLISMAFSPDGARLAAAGDDNTVRLWDVASGRELHVLKGHQGRVGTVTFSPDGARLASAGDDGTVRLWDAAGGRELHVLKGHQGSINKVAFSPDGVRLASAGDEAVRLWDAASGRELHTLKGDVQSVAFSLDGTRLASVGGDGTVQLWDVAGGRKLYALKGHRGSVWCVAFSPDSAFLLASAGEDGTVRLWDADNDGEELYTFQGHQGSIACVAFSPDGARLATAGSDGTVRLWDVANAQYRRAIQGPAADHVAFSPDSARLACVRRGPDHNSVFLWDMAGGREFDNLKNEHGRNVSSVTFSPDGARLASAGDKTVGLWDVASGRELQPLKGHQGEVLEVAFSPDGARLASAGSDGTVRLWDVAGGRELQMFKGHEGAVRSVVFSPDRVHLASAGSDGAVRLWDMAGGHELQSLRGHRGSISKVAFSPDGVRLASAGEDGTVRLWEVASGRELHVLKGYQGAVNSVAFSPDGARLASGGEDGTVRLWEVVGGQEMQVLRGDKSAFTVSSVAFSPDGGRLASAAELGTVQVWDARPLTKEIAVEREARGLVYLLSAKPLLKADVLASIRANKTISEPVRHQALRFAEPIRDDPDRLNDAAWEVVHRPGRAVTDYRQALRAMQTVCQQNAENGDYLNTLGVAQYRAGQYQEALATLTRSEALNITSEKKSNAIRDVGRLLMSPWLLPLTKIWSHGLPGDIAFLAMARHRLGQTVQAQADLTRLRKLLNQPDGTNDSEPDLFLLQEVEAVLQTKPGDGRP